MELLDLKFNETNYDIVCYNYIIDRILKYNISLSTISNPILLKIYSILILQISDDNDNNNTLKDLVFNELVKRAILQ